MTIAAYRIVTEAAVIRMVAEWGGYVSRGDLDKAHLLALRRLIYRGSLIRIGRGRYSDPHGLMRNEVPRQ